ncbi:hypothetical protein PH586_14785 [Pseudomonas sp. SA3-5]|uniref:Uncharacterized protein n=1 Tax=Pseudomonas aestuarii TaxID=3018340 RepID=A0ABT4XHH5_9PSED|nr:hypothetical protein [Pseudomonas aestuarii]MDA7087654.1 hypothetical protein [Pseudomonas aestuarii]
MLEVMRCLDEELKQNPAPDLKAYTVIRFLLDSSITALEKGNRDPQTFDRPSLLASCYPKVKVDGRNPARWLPAGTLETFLDSRRNSLLARIEKAGLDQLPAIGSNDGVGGSGNQRIYWLTVGSAEDLRSMPAAEQDLKSLVYTRTEIGEVKPALFLRLFFKKGELKNRSWRGLLLLISVLLGMLFLSLWILASLWTLSIADQALTLRQLVGSIVVCGFAWIVWQNVYLPWMQLLDNRVAKAASPLLAITEDSAELEMYRDSEKHPWTRFVRFSSDCPLCSGRILLMPGKPDHLVPLVGRCGESPHAHVFSFDRARMSGVYIGPALS